MAIEVPGSDVFNQEIAVNVVGPSGINLMVVDCGTVRFSLQGREPVREFVNDTVRFFVGRIYQPGTHRQSIATASLAVVKNDGSWDFGGWAVFKTEARLDDATGRVIVEADIGVRDIDGFLLQIGYHVTTVAALPSTHTISIPISFGTLQ